MARKSTAERNTRTNYSKRKSVYSFHSYAAIGSCVLFRYWFPCHGTPLLNRQEWRLAEAQHGGKFKLKFVRILMTHPVYKDGRSSRMSLFFHSLSFVTSLSPRILFSPKVFRQVAFRVFCQTFVKQFATHSWTIRWLIVNSVFTIYHSPIIHLIINVILNFYFFQYLQLESVIQYSLELHPYVNP